MRINFYATFRSIVGGKTIEFELASNSQVGDLITGLIKRYPALRQKLLDEAGTLLPYVHIFVNGRDVGYLPEGMQTLFSAGDTVDIFPPVGGGAW